MTDTREAVFLILAMGAVIFFCRAFPFLFFRDGKKRKGKSAEQHGNPGAETAPEAAVPEGAGKAEGASPAQAPFRKRFLSMVERTVPPMAMTVLAVNALAAPVKANPAGALPVFAAAVLTAALHLWKRNALFSISAGTACYMILQRLFV